MARRPGLDALLAHPYLAYADLAQPSPQPTGMADADAMPATASAADARSDAIASPALVAWLGQEGCLLPQWTVEEVPLSISLQAQPPLGLRLSELAAGGVELAGFVDGLTSDALRTALRLGDKLVRIEETPVRRSSYEDVSALISSSSRGGRRPIRLLFERECSAEDECPLPPLPETLDAMLDAPASFTDSPTRASRAAPSGLRPAVVDAGVASAIGARAAQEDTTVLTSFSAIPQGESSATRFTLACVFDGHRGGGASAHAAAAIGPAVQEAIARGEVSPLAVAWRSVCESYRQSGAEDGTTASALLASDDGRCQILNCGDSRTILAAQPEDGRLAVEFATKDHSPADTSEQDRITQAGGRVACASGGVWRVGVESAVGTWQVAVARGEDLTVSSVAWKALERSLLPPHSPVC